MFGNFVKVLALTAVFSLVFTGCTKKPKIDLSGLRENPAGAGALSGDGLGVGPDFSGQGFSAIPGSEPSFPVLAGADSTAATTASGGAWGGLDKPVGSVSGENFLNNPQPWNEIVYFAYDRAEVLPSERYKLDALAKVLLSAPEQGVIIEGHCDERGSDEYNRALSERRALSVREYLATLGVADNQMMTISYGEDKPAVANATTEAEHQLNRRAQFLLGPRK
ncbi:MAG: OmpA family protein [Lentisphaerae bacterium]|jgi:outer membrane protein OmpA-like peptidoglycan-associated protein|nr:OmpA family protein [Lentisphaerota bacterium]